MEFVIGAVLWLSCGLWHAVLMYRDEKDYRRGRQYDSKQYDTHQGNVIECILFGPLHYLACGMCPYNN